MHSFSKVYSFLNSTTFPTSTNQMVDNDNSNNNAYLIKCNITPFIRDRTNPNRVTLTEDDDNEEIQQFRNRQSKDEFSNTNGINTITLTSSNIDSLADRIQDLLYRTTKLSLKEEDTNNNNNKNSLNEEIEAKKTKESSLNYNFSSNIEFEINNNNENINDNVVSFSSSSSISNVSNIVIPRNSTKKEDHYYNNHIDSNHSHWNPISFSTTAFDDNDNDNNNNNNNNKSHTQDIIQCSPPIKYIINNNDELLISHSNNVIIKNNSAEENSKTEARNSSSTNPESIMLEADNILFRIQTLLNKARTSTDQQKHDLDSSVSSSNNSGSSSLLNLSLFNNNDNNTITEPFMQQEQCNKSSLNVISIVPQLQQEFIKSSNETAIESDNETEYYQPPAAINKAEHNNLLINSMIHNSFNQTFNSHVYNNDSKVVKKHNDNINNNNNNNNSNNKVIISSTSSSPTLIKSPSPPLLDYLSSSYHSNPSFIVPNRTILEEEENCLDQMQRDTNELRRLKIDLLQFERDYLKQHQEKKIKKLSTATTTVAANLPQTSYNNNNKKFSKTELNRIASLTHINSINNNNNTKVKQVQPNENHIKLTSTKTKNNEQQPQPQKINYSKSSKFLPSQTNQRDITSAKKNSPSTTLSQLVKGPSGQNGSRLDAEQRRRQQTTNHHGDIPSRRVRFDHQHITYQIEQIAKSDNGGDLVINASRLKEQTKQQQQKASSSSSPSSIANKYKNEPCECCLRHMNKQWNNVNKHSDCAQMMMMMMMADKMRIENDLPRTSLNSNATFVPTITTNDTTNIKNSLPDYNQQNEMILNDKIKSKDLSNKSVQTSIIIGDAYYNPTTIPQQPQIISNIRSKDNDNADGCDVGNEYYSFENNFDYHDRGEKPGSIPRTPSDKAKANNDNVQSMTKSICYFVALNGNEPKKKPENDHFLSQNRQRMSDINQQHSTINNRKSRVSTICSTNMTVPAYTLQDAFDRNMSQFKLRSLMRVRKIKDNEELRIQTADQRKEEITQTYLMRRKIESDHRSRQNRYHYHHHQNNNNKPSNKESPRINQHFYEDNNNNSKPTTMTKKKVMTFNCEYCCNQFNKCPHFYHHQQSRPLPLMTRRVFTHREMRAQTEKVYRKLPEVKAQTVTAKREDDARRRKLMADIFKQRLKENAIRGKLNWPITSQAINS